MHRYMRIYIHICKYIFTPICTHTKIEPRDMPMYRCICKNIYSNMCILTHRLSHEEQRLEATYISAGGLIYIHIYIYIYTHLHIHIYR